MPSLPSTELRGRFGVKHLKGCCRADAAIFTFTQALDVRGSSADVRVKHKNSCTHSGDYDVPLHSSCTNITHPAVTILHKATGPKSSV